MSKFDELEKALDEMEKAEKELDQAISIIREYNRLMLPMWFEKTTPELDAVIMGGDQPRKEVQDG